MYVCTVPPFYSFEDSEGSIGITLDVLVKNILNRRLKVQGKDVVVTEWRALGFEMSIASHCLGNWFIDGD
jgi:hypothetical protein